MADFTAEEINAELERRRLQGLASQFSQEEIDAELAKRTLEKPVEPSGFTQHLKNIGQAAIENLPGEGALAGGLLAGPVGAGIGGGLGAVGKNAIKGIQDRGLKEYITGAPTAEGSLKNAGDIALGAGQGIAYELAGPLIPKGIAKVGSTISGTAEKLALRAAGPFRAGPAKITGKTNIKALGRAALDEGIVGIGDDVGAIATKAKSAEQKIGQEIGDIYAQAEVKTLHPQNWEQIQAAGFSPTRDTAVLKEELAAAMKGRVGGNAAMNKLGNTLDEIALNGETITLQRANQLKGEVDNLIDYNKGPKDIDNQTQALVNEGAKKIRGFIKDKIESQILAIEKTGTLDPGSLEALKAANKRYANVTQLRKIAETRQLANQVNALIGLRDTIVGGGALAGAGGAMSGDVEGAAKGLGAALLFGLTRKFGPATAAKALDLTYNALTNNPVSRQLLKKSPELLEKMIYTTALKISNEPEKP